MNFVKKAQKILKISPPKLRSWPKKAILVVKKLKSDTLYLPSLLSKRIKITLKILNIAGKNVKDTASYRRNDKNYLEITMIDNCFNTIQKSSKKSKITSTSRSNISTKNRPKRQHNSDKNTDNYLRMTIYYLSKIENYFKNKR